MADDCRCQNCGNAGRFVVTVKNPYVTTGQICRNACSKMCAHILARHGVDEMDAHAGYRTESVVEIRSMDSTRVWV